MKIAPRKKVHKQNSNTSFWIGSNPPRKFAEHGSQMIFFVWVADISLNKKKYGEIVNHINYKVFGEDLCAICSNEKPTHILSNSDFLAPSNTLWKHFDPIHQRCWALGTVLDKTMPIRVFSGTSPTANWLKVCIISKSLEWILKTKESELLARCMGKWLFRENFLKIFQCTLSWEHAKSCKNHEWRMWKAV